MTKRQRIDEFNEKSIYVEIKTSEFLLNVNKYIYVEGGILDDEDYHRVLGELTEAKQIMEMEDYEA